MSGNQSGELAEGTRVRVACREAVNFDEYGTVDHVDPETDYGYAVAMWDGGIVHYDRDELEDVTGKVTFEHEGLKAIAPRPKYEIGDRANVPGFDTAYVVRTAYYDSFMEWTYEVSELAELNVSGRIAEFALQPLRKLPKELPSAIVRV